MAKLTVFDTGYCTHPECMITNSFSLVKKKFPAKAWLIESDGKKFLWDTGYANTFFKPLWNHKLYAMITPVPIKSVKNLVVQLKNIDITADQIDTVFISHLHADHCAGLQHFPESKVFLHQDCSQLFSLSKLQLLFNGCLPMLYENEIKSDRLNFFNSLEIFDLDNVLKPFLRGYKVTDDFFIVDLKGHAVGHVGAFIKTDDGWKLLASDSAWIKEAYIDDVYPNRLANIIMHDRAEYEQTLLQLKELYLSGHCEIILSHE
jgi:glyoxylase-like metal-dependent hydrolase (beta-lactamase superfamily II)